MRVLRRGETGVRPPVARPESAISTGGCPILHGISVSKWSCNHPPAACRNIGCIAA
jgi:hypothetical protein